MLCNRLHHVARIDLNQATRTSLRRFLRHQSSATHAPSLSSPAQGLKFHSYFWGNDLWPGTLLWSRRKDRIHSPNQESHLNHNELTRLISSYPPSTSSVSYKPIERLTFPRLLSVYAQLAKARLTTLVVLTAMSSFALSPISTTVPVLLSTALGTTLCSASANTFNQIQEVPYDAQMARTRNRPLARRAITPLHAMGFAVVTGVAGPVLLWTCVNPLTAVIGTANIVLYAGVYTYLKRVSVLNTWVGSVVGGLPPLMGWTACSGHILPDTSEPLKLFLPSFLTSPDMAALPAIAAMDNILSPIALFLFLYSWQFPHFNSLSHFVRTSYAQAGYRMLSLVNPPLNALVSLRHSLLLVSICSILFPLSGLTTWAFALTSLVPNALCVKYSWTFWKQPNDKTARKVFWASLWYLPVVMGLAMVHKNGLDWTSWFTLKEQDKIRSDEEKQTS